jgi:glycosyltransferase involved in cell wall biosynthesis
VYKREIKSQVEAGFKVVYFGWDKPADVKDVDVQFISYADHRLSRKERLKLFVSNRKMVNKLIDLNADVYQFHDFTLLEVGRKLKKAGKHVIFDSHENYLDTIPAKVGNGGVLAHIFKSLMDLYYRKVVSQFDAIFTVSPNFVQMLMKYNPRTYMVSNYPSIKNFEITEAKDKESIFIYQGTVYGFSNQEEIVRAINQVDEDVRYMIIGNIADEEKVITENDIKNRVDIKGWVDKKTLDSILQHSTAGIVIFDYVPECCYKDGQVGSNKIFEYMLNGLPVICTDFRLWKEMIIDKYQCGICVKPGSVEQIKSAVEWMLLNPEESRKMGERGRYAIINEFNWEKGLPEYISLYEQIVKDE